MTNYPTRSNNPMDAPHTDRRPMRWRGINPEWTTTPPTEPGWYWAHGPYSEELFIVHAVQYPGEKGPYIIFMGNDEQKAEYEMTHWLGPLRIPAPPIDPNAV